ncbi:CLUMA_CG011152, isoform A [Clunio marinus]|uniref:CLUMA_CG011152, isoform A n=1 Tax=Clunio marinus TaxID=568069 RepID=A0A1J1IBX0_9DIPT|nr:CLUMA_CG011152, isoform A [Clunio marinus]
MNKRLAFNVVTLCSHMIVKETCEFFNFEATINKERLKVENIYCDKIYLTVVGSLLRSRMNKERLLESSL